MIRAAAIITLLVTIAAAAYFVYEATVVESDYEHNARVISACVTGRIQAAHNWYMIQQEIRRLELTKGEQAALKYKIKHMEEEPVGTPEECDFGNPPPDYAAPATIGIIGLITSLVLFGVSKKPTSEN